MSFDPETHNAMPSRGERAARRGVGKVIAMLAALLATTVLASCSDTPTPTATTQRPPLPTTIASSGGPSGDGGDLSGYITWPNGDPAVNVPVDVYPTGFPNLDDAVSVQSNAIRTGSDGSYLLHCGSACSSLGMEADLPSTTGADAQHGGSECYLLLVYTQQNHQ